MRSEIRKTNPTLHTTDLMRLIGTKWKSLTEEEKKKWVNESHKLNMEDI